MEEVFGRCWRWPPGRRVGTEQKCNKQGFQNKIISMGTLLSLWGWYGWVIVKRGTSVAPYHPHTSSSALNLITQSVKHRCLFCPLLMTASTAHPRGQALLLVLFYQNPSSPLLCGNDLLCVGDLVLVLCKEGRYVNKSLLFIGKILQTLGSWGPSVDSGVGKGKGFLICEGAMGWVNAGRRYHLKTTLRRDFY